MAATDPDPVAEAFKGVLGANADSSWHRPLIVVMALWAVLKVLLFVLGWPRGFTNH